VTTIGYVSWLQPAMGAPALLELALCRRIETAAAARHP
jgi:hypothetical protein